MKFKDADTESNEFGVDRFTIALLERIIFDEENSELYELWAETGARGLEVWKDTMKIL